MKPAAILVCDPYCQGLEHVPFNAGFIQSIHHAWPEAEITPYLERDHWTAIKDYCGDLPLREATPWRPTPAGRRRHAREIRAIWQCLSRARSLGAPVIFLSLSVWGVLFLKAFTRLRTIRQPVIGVLHAPLAVLVGSARGSGGGVRRLLAASILRMRGAASLRFLVLGPSIGSQLRAQNIDLGAEVLSIDHPLATYPDTGKTSRPAVRDSFAFVGVANPRKGMEGFVEVVESVLAHHPGATFRLVGFDPNGVVPETMRPRIQGYSVNALSPQAFDDALRSVRYVVWTGLPEHYALTASGSFVDAMRRGIPVIALRNDFIEHYAQRFGPIGYIEPDIESLVRRVSRCASGDEEHAYPELAENASRCGRVFSPESVALELRRLIANA